MEPPLFIFGDIHGYFDKLVRHLRYAGLANSQAEWTGDDAHLWFMGDFTDRGPDGVGAIDFVMRLQENAARKGGFVGALLGNHDVAILTAKLYPTARTNGPVGTFYQDWLEFGGILSDLDRLETRHIDWLKNLPGMAVTHNRLLVHADAMFYLNYGETLPQANAELRALLHSDNTENWDALLGYAGQRFEFDERRAGGKLRAMQMLSCYGGRQIIHGHTIISTLSGEPLDRITRAYKYCEGLAIDVDGGMYKGGAGFVYEAPPLDDGRTG